MHSTICLCAYFVNSLGTRLAPVVVSVLTETWAGCEASFRTRLDVIDNRWVASVVHISITHERNSFSKISTNILTFIMPMSMQAVVYSTIAHL